MRCAVRLRVRDFFAVCCLPDVALCADLRVCDERLVVGGSACRVLLERLEEDAVRRLCVARERIACAGSETRSLRPGATLMPLR